MSVWQRFAPSWGGRFFLILFAVFGMVAASYAGTTVTRTNNNSSGVDGEFVTRTVNIGAGAVPGGAQVSQVIITVDFEKIDGGLLGAEPNRCSQVGGPGHQGGFAWNPEIHMTLISPAGTRIVLIEDDLNTGGSGVGPTYTDLDYTGPVSVTFREGMFPLVGGPGPVSGTFLPEEVLFAFNGESPVGTWTLEMSDNFPEDPLCFDSFTLQVSTDGAYEVGTNMSMSAYDPAFNGSGFNFEILSLVQAKDGEKGTTGLVLVYWYSFDIFGFPIFAFGVGDIIGDAFVVEMLINYGGSGPIWGPGWDPDDFEGFPFALLVIIWDDCEFGIAGFELDPSFLAVNPGWLEYIMLLERLTNVVGLPPC